MSVELGLPQRSAEVAQVVQTLDRTAAIPGSHRTVDQRHTCMAARWQLVDDLDAVALAEGVGFGGKQHDIERTQERGPQINGRVTRFAFDEVRIPTHRAQHARDVSVPRHRHPGRFPNEIEHPLPRPQGSRRYGVLEIALETPAETVRSFFSQKDPAQQTIQAGVVGRAERMRHDDMRNEARQLLHRRARVFIDVDDEMRGREALDARNLDALGAAYFRHALHELAGMHAEAGPPNDLGSKTQIEQQLGNARHQRDDAGRRTCDFVHGTLRVDEVAFIRSRGWRHGAALGSMKFTPWSMRPLHPCCGELNGDYSNLARARARAT